MRSRYLKWILAAAVVWAISGCGYTMKSNLPESAEYVHIAPVKNGINLSEELNEKTPFKPYRPGLEVEVMNALINRFIFDGNLKVTSAVDKADLVVNCRVTDYRRDAFRYKANEDVQEYRLTVVADITVYNPRTHKIFLSVKNVAGDSHYYLTGRRALSEDEAATAAVTDLARRIVEKTVEAW